MTRDPLLPVRLVDGVWTTEGAGSAAVADLADHMPGDNAEQRLGALGLACVGALTLTTAIAVLAVALGVCL